MYPIMLPTGIRQSCFRMKFSHGPGTSFIQFVSEKSFLVTARHVVNGIIEGDKYALHLGGNWEYFTAKKFCFCLEGSDLAVLRAPEIFDEFPGWGVAEKQASPSIWLGQPAVYLGFPLGLDCETPPSVLPHVSAILGRNAASVAPFMKTGHMCGSIRREKYNEYYFDSINNAGFSGGPVFTSKGRSGLISMEDAQAVAVVVRYHYDNKIPVLRENEQRELEPLPDYWVRPNSGYMVAVPISNALKAARTLV